MLKLIGYQKRSSIPLNCDGALRRLLIPALCITTSSNLTPTHQRGSSPAVTEQLQRPLLLGMGDVSEVRIERGNARNVFMDV
jgi:hypothetical protein